MISKILVATDGSETAQKAAKYGVNLAKQLKASVIVLSAIDFDGTLRQRKTDGAPIVRVLIEAGSGGAVHNQLRVYNRQQAICPLSVIIAEVDASMEVHL